MRVLHFSWGLLLSTLAATVICDRTTQRAIALSPGAEPLRSLAQSDSTPATPESTCSQPVLDRLVRHQVAPGETVESIAQKYNLIPVTLMGLNPSLRGGTAPVGATILVPPYNGIRVELASNQTLRDVAQQYKVRPDVLFEVNGCQQRPKVVFVPGVNWSPVVASGEKPTVQVERSILGGSPLQSKPSKANILLGYGWVLQPALDRVAFHSGIDLAAAVGSSVLAVGDGTVAYAAQQGTYGNLVVINHSEGLQTRYAQLSSIKVKVGQTVNQGQVIGTVGTTGRPSSLDPHLHFEVRSRSNLGWIAEDPALYLLKDVPKTAQKSQ